MNSATKLALSKKQCDPESLMVGTPPPACTGTNGNASVNNMNWCPISPKDPMQLAGSKYLLNEYTTAGFPPPTTMSELGRWQMPLPLLRQRTQWPASPTHA
jgi:hypothetical protein